MSTTTTTNNRNTTIAWTKIDPVKDPQYGVPCTRSSHGVSLLQKGTQLVVYGGEHEARVPIGPENNFWVATKKKDDDNWQWRCIVQDDSNKKVPPIRIAHAQAVYQDQYIYIFGGRAGIVMEEKAMNDLWKLDIGTQEWTLIQDNSTNNENVPEARSFHKMICIQDDLYVFGGCTAQHGRAADLWKYHIPTNTWSNLTNISPTNKCLLRGRGGPNLLSFPSNQSIAIISGFVGEETNDAQFFHIQENQWEESIHTFETMRPRSVCVCGTFPSKNKSILFGGEVDPSERGHEGAGGFENDIVVFEQTNDATTKNRASLSLMDTQTMKDNTTTTNTTPTSENWPKIRGWSAADIYDDGDTSTMYIFGGLTGDDKSPERLNDLWKLDIS